MRRRKSRKHPARRDNTKPSEGVLRVHPKGFGFVTVPDRTKDIYIRARHLGAALDGDRVHVRWTAAGDPRVVAVLHRARSRAVGTLRVKHGAGQVISEDVRLIHPILVDSKDQGAATHGDKVEVSIDRFEEGDRMPVGRVLRVLGPASDPAVRVLAVAMSLDVRADFPGDVLQEAEAIPRSIPAAEIARRLDLRELNVFTIDPADARDLDDALHVRRIAGGNIEVGVHIADVSHYVKHGTQIDQEGYARGTSVYLVDRVIPMLPDVLSGDVCSLHPHEDKLTYSCIMELTPKGTVVRYAIRETIIHSRARLSYAEAQDVLDGRSQDHALASDLALAWRLAGRLAEQRTKGGSLDFDLPEVRVLLDNDAVATGFVSKERTAAHRLIEECMILANRTVAKHIEEAQPFVYRVHGYPDKERIARLADYVRIFGYSLPLKNGRVSSGALNTLLAAVRGSAEEAVITKAALRAMTKATYATENTGHFGLGLASYTHFTSPIRRYPDLIVHRLLKRNGRGDATGAVEPLTQQCQHCSEREKAAENAERASVKLKQVEYMRRHVGDTFDGIISGVCDYGIFVELRDVFVEGLAHFRDMGDDFYYYDESTYRVIASSSGASYQPGQAVTVQVLHADTAARTVDLSLVR